ncbi:MAG: phosphatidylglycerol lysyltransferase domain-containing protein, partial [Mycoplasma sp.]
TKYESDVWPENDDIWSLTSCFYNDESDIEKMKKLISKQLLDLNKSDELRCVNISECMIKDFNLSEFNVVQQNYISNYIYELEKMKTFSGNKLQKKRNHMNFFKSQNHNLKIVNINDVEKDELIKFSEYHIEKYSGENRKYEIDVYKQFLEFEVPKTEKFFGTVIYIDDRIVGFTLCFLRKGICEVIIEKAERDIRGLYQFLISTNLTFHNINAQYMDREDDAGILELAKSKHSYYPIATVNRYNILGLNTNFEIKK